MADFFGHLLIFLILFVCLLETYFMLTLDASKDLALIRCDSKLLKTLKLFPMKFCLGHKYRAAVL